MKYIEQLIFSFFFILSGCASIQEKVGIETVSNKSDISIIIEKASYSSSEQLQKYILAIELAEQVINSDSFRDVVLNGPMEQQFVVIENEEETKSCGRNARTTYSYNVTNDQCYSNYEIYELIRKADWRFNVKVNTRQWALWCGWPWVNEVGHRESDTIVTQECWVDKMTSSELAGHLIHEYLHILGFGHPYDKKYAVKRMTTVPYFIGDKAYEFIEKANKSSSSDAVVPPI